MRRLFVHKLQPFVVAYAIGILSATPASAGFFDENIEKACPQAALEKEQLLAKRPQPKPVANITRPALQNELLQMEREDQAVRERFVAAINAHGGDLPMDDPTRLAAIHVDEANLPKLKHIFNQDGFPTTVMVGIEGVQAAFLLATHADDDPLFQANILKIITPRLRKNEIDGNQYALLTDRVLVAQGKHQRYGTQFEGRGDQMKPKPIQDEAHVDERRRALGLISIENYTCVLHAVYDPQ
jgi:hypothetical protein